MCTNILINYFRATLPDAFCHVTTASGNMAATCTSTDGAVRKRHVASSKGEEKPADVRGGRGAQSSQHGERKEAAARSLHSGTYWLTRIVLLRCVAFIYGKKFHFSVIISSVIKTFVLASKKRSNRYYCRLSYDLQSFSLHDTIV